MITRATELHVGRAVEHAVAVRLQGGVLHVADAPEDLGMRSGEDSNIEDVATRQLGIEVGYVDSGRQNLRRRLLLHGGPVLLGLASLHLHGEAAAVAGLVLGAHLLAVQEQRAGTVFLRAHLDVAHALRAAGVLVANQLDRLHLCVSGRISQPPFRPAGSSDGATFHRPSPADRTRTRCRSRGSAIPR